MKETQKILDDNEKVLWEGTPKFLPFLIGGSAVSVIFGFFWMIMLLPFIGAAAWDIFSGSGTFGFGIFLLPHFWVGIFLLIGSPAYKILVFKKTYYTITDKRVIIQKGVIGRDFDAIDFDQITNTDVNISITDKLFGKNTGSINIYTASTMVYSRDRSYQRPYSIRNVVNPYEVFKFLKSTSHNVKTDIQYPNQLRPANNPGYNTELTQKNK